MKRFPMLLYSITVTNAEETYLTRDNNRPDMSKDDTYVLHSSSSVVCSLNKLNSLLLV